MAKSNYEEASIRVLKGLQPVRERPGMYTRTSDPTHIVQETIDNAADEALGGYATRIDDLVSEWEYAYSRAGDALVMLVVGGGPKVEARCRELTGAVYAPSHWEGRR